jgi:hypothetical protein
MQAVERTGRQIAPALVIALGSTIAGGLVAAATARVASEKTSWAAAYLVLVGGVATLGLALGRGFLSPARASGRSLGVELLSWVAGNALVFVGTLVDLTWLVDVGGALLVAALALIVVGVRRGPGPGWVRGAFTGLVVLLLVSIPVGLVLARLGN